MNATNSTTKQIVSKPPIERSKERNYFWQKGFNKGPGEYIALEKGFACDVGNDNDNFLLVSS